MSSPSVVAAPRPDLPRRIARYVPGLGLCLTLAIAAHLLAGLEPLRSRGVGTLIVALLLGIAIGNTVYRAQTHACTAGVDLSRQRILRLAIIFYGLRLTFQDVAGIGWGGVLVDAFIVCSTFALALWLGPSRFKQERESAILIGAGSAICGAAAVLATAPLVKAQSRHVAVAIATVVVFGTLGTFLYPLLVRWNAEAGLLSVASVPIGLFFGSTIHEVAQVVAAAEAVGAGITETAVVAKMVRVMMLAPFLFGLSIWMARGASQGNGVRAQAATIVIPWFAVGFIAMIGLNSLHVLPAALVEVMIEADAFLLAMAMAAVGIGTRLKALRDAGAMPLALGAALFVWLVVAGFAANLLLLGLR